MYHNKIIYKERLHRQKKGAKKTSKLHSFSYRTSVSDMTEMLCYIDCLWGINNPFTLR